MPVVRTALFLRGSAPTLVPAANHLPRSPATPRRPPTKRTVPAGSYRPPELHPGRPEPMRTGLYSPWGTAGSRRRAAPCLRTALSFGAPPDPGARPLSAPSQRAATALPGSAAEGLSRCGPAPTPPGAPPQMAVPRNTVRAGRRIVGPGSGPAGGTPRVRAVEADRTRRPGRRRRPAFAVPSAGPRRAGAAATARGRQAPVPLRGTTAARRAPPLRGAAAARRAPLAPVTVRRRRAPGLSFGALPPPGGSAGRTPGAVPG